MIYNFSHSFRPQRRTAKTSSEAPMQTYKFLTNIVSSVNHNGTLFSQMVNPLLQTNQSQGIAVFTCVSSTNPEKPKAGLQAAGTIGKFTSTIKTAVFPMRNQFLTDQFRPVEIKNPETLFN